MHLMSVYKPNDFETDLTNRFVKIKILESPHLSRFHVQVL